MNSAPVESTPKLQAKFQSKFLLGYSIVNILIFPLCVGLEAWSPLAGQGIWGSIAFVVTGLLGFSVSYKPKKPLIISTMVFSVLSICFAVISASTTIGGGLRNCSYVQSHSVCSGEGFNRQCTYHQSHSVCYFLVNPIMLTIANIVSLINNMIVTVLLSKVICKCCNGSVVSSVPIVEVHNPSGNPQQLTPMWTVSPTGQQQQFPSYPTVVYSSFEQQPMHLLHQQQGQQQWQDQHPSAPARTLPRENIEPTANVIINSPPPYSTLPNGAALEPLPKKESYKS